MNTFHLDTVYNVIRFNSRRRWCSGDTTEVRRRERKDEQQRVQRRSRRKRQPFLSLIISARTRAIVYIYTHTHTDACIHISTYTGRVWPQPCYSLTINTIWVVKDDISRKMWPQSRFSMGDDYKSRLLKSNTIASSITFLERKAWTKEFEQNNLKVASYDSKKRWK